MASEDLSYLMCACCGLRADGIGAYQQGGSKWRPVTLWSCMPCLPAVREMALKRTSELLLDEELALKAAGRTLGPDLLRLGVQFPPNIPKEQWLTVLKRFMQAYGREMRQLHTPLPSPDDFPVEGQAYLEASEGE